MSSSSYLSFLLQCLISPLSQAVQTAELILELKQLSLVSVVRGLLLHLEATAGILKKNTRTLENAGQEAYQRASP